MFVLQVIRVWVFNKGTKTNTRKRIVESLAMKYDDSDVINYTKRFNL